MASSIYNLRHPLRTGNIRLAPSGKELFGTVIRDGKMNKTVTVSSITYERLMLIGSCFELPLEYLR